MNVRDLVSLIQQYFPIGYESLTSEEKETIVGKNCKIISLSKEDPLCEDISKLEECKKCGYLDKDINEDPCCDYMFEREQLLEKKIGIGKYFFENLDKKINAEKLEFGNEDHIKMVKGELPYSEDLYKNK